MKLLYTLHKFTQEGFARGSNTSPFRIRPERYPLRLFFIEKGTSFNITGEHQAYLRIDEIPIL